MNAETTLEPATDADEPAVAFEAMTRRLAGLTAAMEGFAARQQELHARDYGPDLAKIHDMQARFRAAIETLSQRPGMELTPQQIESQIEAAGRHARAADHHAWTHAHRELQETIQSVRGVVASAVTAEKQKLWIAGAAAAALAVGGVLGMVVPTLIAWAAPESWHWPEKKAASLLGRDGWEAGIRLLEVSDANRLRLFTEAGRVPAISDEHVFACNSGGRPRSGARCAPTAKRMSRQ